MVSAHEIDALNKQWGPVFRTPKKYSSVDKPGSNSSNGSNGSNSVSDQSNQCNRNPYVLSPPPLRRQPNNKNPHSNYEKYMNYNRAATVIQSHVRSKGSQQHVKYIRLVRNSQARMIQRKMLHMLWNPNSRLVRNLELEFNKCV